MVKLDFKNLIANELVLIIAPSNLIQETNLKVMKYFIAEKDYIGLYLTLSKPYKTLIGILNKNKVKTDKVFFIDCVTPVSGPGEMHGTSKVIFVQPQSLTNISIALTTAIKNLPKDQNRILIIDTISTLMLYNDKETVIKFLHNLSAKIREYKIKSLIFSLDAEEDKKIIPQISQFCDVTMKIKE